MQLGAEVDLSRARLEESRGSGLSAFAATARLTDVAIEHVRESECAAVGCPVPLGVGIGSYADAAVTVTRFLVRDTDLCGVHLASGGGVDLHDGEVSENPLGACIDAEGYDLDRLTDGVRYRDNELNLQSTSLPLPAVPDDFRNLDE